MATGGDLEKEIAALRVQLEAERLRMRQAEVDAGRLQDEVVLAREREKKQMEMPVYSTRKLARFRGQPENSSEPTIDEWVEDVKSQIAVRRLKTAEQAAFIIDNLAGQARREILARADDIRSDPTKILATLSKVFGSAETLPTLLQKFFSYEQKEKDDLLTCSLQLVGLYDQICCLEQSYKPSRNTTLKGRLAESVWDEGLRRELRRLNIESAGLDYFEMRDRAVHWIGDPQKKKKVTVQEVSANDQILKLLQTQAEQLSKQQQQLDELFKQPQPRTGVRKCYRCQSTTHLIRECPEKAKNKPPEEQVPKTSSNQDSKDF